MIRNKTDLNYYDNAESMPDYKGWFLQSIGKDGCYSFAGGTDSSVLPKADKGIPAGSTALATDGALYVLNAGNEWSMMVEG